MCCKVVKGTESAVDKTADNSADNLQTNLKIWSKQRENSLRLGNFLTGILVFDGATYLVSSSSSNFIYIIFNALKHSGNCMFCVL
jgi:hypothetical protein